MLKRVSEIPARILTGRKSYVEQDIRTFVRNETMDMAELTYEGKSASAITTSAKKYIARNPDTCAGIEVTKRGEHVYLIKEIVR